jgi:hypothetical protein
MAAQYEGGPHDGMTGTVPLNRLRNPPRERRLQVAGELYSRNWRGKGAAKPQYAIYEIAWLRQGVAVYRFKELAEG